MQGESEMGKSTRRKFANLPPDLITTRQTSRPLGVRFFGYSHVEFWVSNPQQVADHYCTRFGFIRIAYKGLYTGSRDICSHVVRQNDIVFVFTGPYKPDPNSEYAKFLAIHGDAVRDQAYYVSDVNKLVSHARSQGARILRKPEKVTDNFGSILISTIWLYGNVTVTLIEKLNYKGPFMPGFEAVSPNDDVLQKKLEPVGLQFVDHIVGNQPEGEMLTIAEKFSKYFGFHVFWSVDDKDVRGDISALKSIVMTDWDMNIKQPLNEPAYNETTTGLSQIEEYLIYHGEPGVQHIALNTYSIITAIKALRSRGLKFLSIDDEYYDDLRKRLNSQQDIEVREDLDILQELQILVDFDENGYLLQIFSQPVQDRPTLFIEVIQRRNHDGFGKGNFNALFKSLEMEQVKRGNGKKTDELTYKGPVSKL